MTPSASRERGAGVRTERTILRELSSARHSPTDAAPMTWDRLGFTTTTPENTVLSKIRTFFAVLLFWLLIPLFALAIYGLSFAQWVGRLFWSKAKRKAWSDERARSRTGGGWPLKNRIGYWLERALAWLVQPLHWLDGD